MVAEGLVDAHDATGRGFGFTWSRFGLPLMRLDHVLVTGELGVDSSNVIDGPGSDHAILVVDVSGR